MATWIAVDSNKKLTAYVDTATIRRAGSIVKIWNLLDLKTAVGPGSNEPYLSVKVQTEYDCTGEQVRILSFTECNVQRNTNELSRPMPMRFENHSRGLKVLAFITNANQQRPIVFAFISLRSIYPDPPRAGVFARAH
jgi:hypothetical protein